MNISQVTHCKALCDGYYPKGSIVPFKVMYENRYSFLCKGKRNKANEDNWDGWSSDNKIFLRHFELIFPTPIKIKEDLSYLIPILKNHNII